MTSSGRMAPADPQQADAKNPAPPPRVPEAVMAKEEDLDEDEMEPEEEGGEQGEACASALEATPSASSPSRPREGGGGARHNLLSLKTNSLKRSITLPRNPFASKAKVFYYSGVDPR